MSRLARILALGAASALLTSALAVPVAALPTPRTEVAFVNGIPGKAVDVCINGWEAKSYLRYGKTFVRDFGNAGQFKKVQFRAASKGRCKGKILAGRKVWFEFGGDISIVATPRKPKVLVFDNSELPMLKAVAVPVPGVVRIATSVGPVFLYERHFDYGVENPLGPANAVATSLRKSQQAYTWVQAGYWLQLRAKGLQVTGGGIVPQVKEKVLFKPTLGKRFEVYLVGTKAGNTRFVVLQRAIANP